MDKKNALEISKFAGIDQLDRGTATPANFAHTLKNVHPVSLSELKTIEGVNDVSGGADLPSVDEIIHECIHKDFGGSEKRLVFFKPNITSSTNFGENLISASNFSASGGTSQLQNFYVVLYGAGGCYKTVPVWNVPLNSGPDELIVFTPPNGIPDFVCQINIYQINIGYLIPEENYQYASGLVASITRRNGVFPPWAAFRNRGFSTITNPSDSRFLNQITPTHMSVRSYGNSGSLEGGRIYYTGIASNTAPDSNTVYEASYPRCRLFDQQGNPLSFYLPEGRSSVLVRYYFANTTVAVNPNTALTPGGPECFRAWFFLGTTPEDVLLGGKSSVIAPDGMYSTIDRVTSAKPFQSANHLGDTIFSNHFNFDDESPVLLYSIDPGNLPGGLQNNTVYWVKYSIGPKNLKLATSYSNLKNNIFVDITSNGGNYSFHGLNQITFNVIYDHIPYNSNNGVTMVQNYSNFPRQMGGSLQQGDPNRRDGVFVNSQFWPIVKDDNQPDYVKGQDYRYYPVTGAADNLGCWVLPDGVFNNKAYQLLANINEKNFSLTGFSKVSLISLSNFVTSPLISPSLFWCPSDKVISSFQSTIRTYLANGDNGLFYTNGYVLKPMIRSNGKVYIPTSKYIYGFGTRLVCGGGPASYQNSKNQVYYSNPDLPFDWGTGAINTINVFTEQDINGFGAYSQNLTTSGFAQFLFISKKDGAFSWDGNPSNGAQQLYYGFGMASPRSFVETDFGPVFVSRGNIYILEGGSFREIGDNVQPILESLSNQQLERIVAVYHDKIVKIGYPSGTNTELDREIWLDQRIERGQAVRIYSGPHEMKPYRTQSTSIIFGTDRDVRYSSLGKRVYQRDIGKLNDGANINYSIVHNRLGFERDLFWKLITDIYVATLVQQDENITITLGFEDGTSNYVGTLACPVANTRQLCQHLIRSRPRGRIVSLTLSGSSNEPISIFNISILFELQKRRLLRYS